jgi:hypothetical protein
MNALPTHVYHCDWGSAPKKRWMSRAVRHDDGHFTAFAASQVVDPAALISSILREIGGGCAMVGFDFPIGLPDFYAIANNIIEFKPGCWNSIRAGGQTFSTLQHLNRKYLSDARSILIGLEERNIRIWFQL